MSTGQSTSITDTIGATGISNQMTWIASPGPPHLPGVLLVCRCHGEKGVIRRGVGVRGDVAVHATDTCRTSTTTSCWKAS